MSKMGKVRDNKEQRGQQGTGGPVLQQRGQAAAALGDGGLQDMGPMWPG